MDLSLANWKHGARRLESGAWCFRLWAHNVKQLQLRLLDAGEGAQPLQSIGGGYYEVIVERVEAGTRYFYQVEGRDLPDPASRFQPEGVHGPSALVDADFQWQDEGWEGIPLEQYLLYELHVGTFTPEGTFDAVIPHLESLKELGVTAIELMPVAQFPGGRNWGYDGAQPFAAQNSYGGPDGLRRLVNACHGHGLAVVLDVVYNHLGPEGNYLSNFAPYFTERYKTPWGAALNFDGEESDEVRRYFVENALYWIAECHTDALRLDAIHAIHDESAVPFLQDVADAVRAAGEQLGRRTYAIAESNLNDPRVVRPQSTGGIGLSAQWSDDFHHSLAVLLTGERDGYYQDFEGLPHLAKAYAEGFVYSGQHSAFRRRRHGNSSGEIPASRLVVCSQNHDQVGNRMLGERPSTRLSYEQLKLAAAAVLLSPFLPLLFMGEEYGETAPFLYFVSHSDPGLIQGVREGRKREFASFAWQGTPPDPQDERTFLRSKLDHGLREQPANANLRAIYRELIRLRNELPAFALLSKEQMEVTAYAEQRLLCLRRWNSGDEAIVFLCFSASAVTATPRLPEGRWRKILDSSEQRWLGPGEPLPEWISGGAAPIRFNPHSVTVYQREAEE